jgi:siroheme synthase (precorrin-2 oxidase/ferrochelatase)
MRQGALTIAISTNGCAPALAVRLRQQFERTFGPEYATFLDWLQALREPWQHNIPISPSAVPAGMRSLTLRFSRCSSRAMLDLARQRLADSHC